MTDEFFEDENVDDEEIILNMTGIFLTLKWNLMTKLLRELKELKQLESLKS